MGFSGADIAVTREISVCRAEPASPSRQKVTVLLDKFFNISTRIGQMILDIS